jgi:hypothetical protein
MIEELLKNIKTHKIKYSEYINLSLDKRVAYLSTLTSDSREEYEITEFECVLKYCKFIPENYEDYLNLKHDKDIYRALKNRQYSIYKAVQEGKLISPEIAKEVRFKL